MYRLVNWAFDQFNNKCPILIQTPASRSFGNSAQDIYFGLLRAKRENKKILFLYPRLRLFNKGLTVSNRELFHLQSDYSLSNNNIIGLFGGILLSLYTLFLWTLNWIRNSLKLRRVLRLFWSKMNVRATFDYGYTMSTIGRSALWKPHGINKFSWDIVEKQNWKNQHDGYTPPKLSEDKHRYAREIRIKMGIPLSDWFVCLHVRENNIAKGRGASIHNYIEGIKAITDMGGWVIYIGDTLKNSLLPMERVIDFSHNRYKSALMDIYFISQCHFFIALGSGPIWVATLFQKPIIFINMVNWSGGLTLNKGDLAIMKHIFSYSHNRLLSIKEILEEPFKIELFDVPSQNYIYLENTPAEIKEIIKEFLTRPKPYENTDLQEAFNEGRKKQAHQWIDQSKQKNYVGVSESHIITEQYRVASLIDALGILGQRYLEQNWYTDKLEISSTQIDQAFAEQSIPHPLAELF